MKGKYKMPIIGITLDYFENGDYANYPYYILRCNYAKAIEDSGGIPIFLHYSKELVDEYLDCIDGLLIPGGNFDISPDIYGEKTTSDRVSLNANRTEFEYAILDKALKMQMPILGICGGQQLINVVLGGTLIQDIDTEIDTNIEHEQKIAKHLTSHDIEIKSESLLYKIIKRDRISVNSTHHQAVKILGKGLIASAKSDDGIIEAIELDDYEFCLGVQWHPEYMTTSADHDIFKSFVNICR